MSRTYFETLTHEEKSKVICDWVDTVNKQQEPFAKPPGFFVDEYVRFPRSPFQVNREDW